VRATPEAKEGCAKRKSDFTFLFMVSSAHRLIVSTL